MSTENHTPEHEAPHEGPIKTPRQLIIALLLSFIVPVVVILMLANYVSSSTKPAAGSDRLSKEAIAKRLQPVGTVEVKDVSDPAAMKTGEQVFAAQCAVCHSAGVAGAPKIGDSAAWAPRIKTGYDALLNSALKGKGTMGPQAGGDHTDFEIARAVVYIANQGGAKFEEPKMPVPAAAASAAQPAAATPPTAPATAALAPAAPAAPAQPAVAAAAPKAATGAPPALYTQSCAACHAAGIAGAPKLGDAAAWSARLPQGVDALTASVIAGKGVMPPRGGSAGSDADIKAAVAYMVGTVK